jgi:hypothetical protein
MESLRVPTPQIQRLIETPAMVHEVIQREVPMLSENWGAKDEDALVHTLGVNLLAGIGRSLGFVGIAEYPVPRAAQWQRKLVRVDSAWFDPSNRKLVLLAEFERFSRETAIEKLTNLFVASHGCDSIPQALLLCLWSLDGVAVDTPWLNAERPLAVPGGPPVEKPKDAAVFVVHAVFGRHGEHLHFLRLRRLS